MKTLMLNEGKLARQPFVRNASPEFLNVLANVATEATFRKGEVIFREMEFADRFFLILSGKVSLQSDRDARSGVLIQTLGPGEALGWSWLFPPFQWHFTAQALEPCRVLAFNAASLLVRAEEDPVFGYELMKRISGQVILRLQATRERFIHKLALKEPAVKGTGERPTQRQADPYADGARSARLGKPAGGRKTRRTTAPAATRQN